MFGCPLARLLSASNSLSVGVELEPTTLDELLQLEPSTVLCELPAVSGLRGFEKSRPCSCPYPSLSGAGAVWLLDLPEARSCGAVSLGAGASWILHCGTVCDWDRTSGSLGKLLELEPTTELAEPPELRGLRSWDKSTPCAVLSLNPCRSVAFSPGQPRSIVADSDPTRPFRAGKSSHRRYPGLLLLLRINLAKGSGTLLRCCVTLLSALQGGNSGPIAPKAEGTVSSSSRIESNSLLCESARPIWGGDLGPAWGEELGLVWDDDLRPGEGEDRTAAPLLRWLSPLSLEHGLTRLANGMGLSEAMGGPAFALSKWFLLLLRRSS
mmetsp:Transcript_51105/g.135011  ORF Transcript_51105/g.135011 Transcript_51105/m.135011 type:complete len:324 (+) Transcript_51105:466-1437(+)